MRLMFENRYRICAASTATHIYLLPHPGLRPIVAHYTLCLASPAGAAGGSLELIPDASGCLVFTLENGALEGRMYGPTTRVVTVHNDLGACPFRFFVEFRPGGLRFFTPIPQWELADRVLPLADTAPGLGALVEDCFHRAPDLDEFVRAVDEGLCRRADGAGCIQPLLYFLASNGSPRRMTELAEESGYSQRHLSRLFREGAGLSAKAFSRVLRINEAVRRLPAAESLTRLALDLGYYDQSHFIHEFRAVCGVSPTRYLERLSIFYNEPLKF